MTDCTERQLPAPRYGAEGEGQESMTRKAQS
jgi:hypothetical protein